MSISTRTGRGHNIVSCCELEKRRLIITYKGILRLRSPGTFKRRCEAAWLKWLQGPGGFKIRMCEPVTKAEFDVSGSNQSTHLIRSRPLDVPPP